MAFQVKGLLKVYIKLNSCCLKSTFKANSPKKLKTVFLGRQARFIGKLLAENAAERRQWNKGLTTPRIHGAGNLSPKRLETLNRLFLVKITDGLLTSTRGEELANLGLLINRVDLSHCGQSLKVLWSSSSAESDEQVAKTLEDCQGELYDNIVSKTVGGFVPRFVFTKDAEMTRMRDVEYILSLPSVVKDLTTEITEKWENTDEQESESKEVKFDVEISTNILGLRRGDILRRVMAVSKRLRKADQKLDDEDEDIPVENLERINTINIKSQKAAIGAFMRKFNKTEKEIFLNSLSNLRYKKAIYEDLYELDDAAETEEFDDDAHDDSDHLADLNCNEPEEECDNGTDLGNDDKLQK